jgi:hypothetical protein
LLKVGDLKLGGYRGGEYKVSYVAGVGSRHSSGKKYELRNPHAKNGFFYKCETYDEILKLLKYFNVFVFSRKKLNNASKGRILKAFKEVGLKRSREIFDECDKKYRTLFNKEKNEFEFVKNKGHFRNFEKLLLKLELKGQKNYAKMT